MKKVLEQILQDDNYFNRKRPELSFSATELREQVAYGKTIQGTITVSAAEAFEGYVYCADLRMSVAREHFDEKHRDILFQFDAKGLEEGSISRGKFVFVTNGGEYEIPYEIQVQRDLPVSSMGEIRNLFHFANLAKSDWSEAVQLFYSSRFLRVLKNSPENYEDYETIYRSLKQIPLYKDAFCEAPEQTLFRDQNVENFLVYTRKKTRITYMTDVAQVQIEDPEEQVTERICIVREGWGYSHLKIDFEGAFIRPLATEVLTEDFHGNVYELEYQVLLEELYPGENKGKIIISDLYHRLEIPVLVTRSCKERIAREEELHKKALLSLMRKYLDFRLGRVSKSNWIKENTILLNRMLHRDANDIETRLYQAHLFITEGNSKEAELILLRLSALLEEQQVSPSIRGYYLYLTSLCDKSNQEIRDLAQQVEYLYVKDTSNWRLAWMLLYLKQEYLDNDQKKWEFIKQQYALGATSPVLYIEAMQTVNRTPSVLAELGAFEMAFLTFIKRQKVFTREIRSRFLFLADKVKVFSKEILSLLYTCYELDPKDETLQLICQHLMKGNKIGKEYFAWYALGVDHELRINRLYEYYLMSIDLQYEGKLPKLILMYFAYRSNMDYERNAFLYVNILRYKKEYRDLYQVYEPLMEDFVREQLKKGRLNGHLALLYRAFLPRLMQSPEYANALFELYFTVKIRTNCDSMIHVVVSSPWLKQEASYPIYQGEAMIQLLGEDCVIALEDQNGDRYFDAALYEKELILNNTAELRSILPYADNGLTKALYYATEHGQGIVIQEKNADILHWLALQPNLTEQYQIMLRMALLEYYFEQDEISLLDELLLEVEPEALSGKQRESCIHIMVARGMYLKAMEWIRSYGIEEVDYKILLRLCDRVLMHTDFAYDSEIVRICQSTFCSGRYDESMLKYLLKYAKGSSMELKALWRAADSFELEVRDLLEQLLLQILFSGCSIGEETNLYLEYVSRGSNTNLEKAFLVMLAYRYFNKGEAIEVRVFDRVIAMLSYEEDIPVLCKLAYLKKTTEVMKKGRLFDAEKQGIPVLIKEMSARQIFFPLFLEFKHLCPQLELLDDRSFIEYRGKEGSRVILHYMIENEQTHTREYKKEEMPHVYAGIYVKAFILFAGEKIHYYITEEDGRQEKLTQSSVLECQKVGQATSDTRYAMINRMVESRQEKDYELYCRTAAEYAKKNYLISHLFRPE